MATLKDIQTRITRLQQQAEAIAARQSSTIIARIRSMMEDHGITIDDIRSATEKRGNGSVRAVAKTGSGPSSARYRDPQTGATWTGHGRAPAWLAAAKNRDRFLIEGDAASARSIEQKPAKPGNYVRGPQPAMYRDPKTGAEWSGRGRAPAWLATVSDRTRFLIAQPAQASANGALNANGPQVRPATANKAVSGKAAARKAAVKKSTVKSATAKRVITKKTTAKTASKKPAAKKASAPKASTVVTARERSTRQPPAAQATHAIA